MQAEETTCPELVQCAEAHPVWELSEDVLAVQDDLDEVLDVVLVVVNAAELAKELVLGDVEVVDLEELTVVEDAADSLPKVDVVVEVLVVERFLHEAFDVVPVLEDAVKIECDVDVEWDGVVVQWTTCVVF